MLRVIVHKSAAAALKYYTEGLSREDYYSEGQEVVGKWHGKAAELLGLSGEVGRQEFAALVENRNPDSGERLTARMNAERRVGYDLNFSAPKSLSVLQGLTGDKALLDAFRSAVSETMTEIELQATTRVRRGKQDSERVTGNLVWAEFIHFTARPVDGVPDPQLHIHNFAPNVSYDSVEGRWKAVSWAGIKGDAPYYEAAFRSRLANKVADLGYSIRQTRHGWEIAGVPSSVIDRFSRRSAEINRLAEEMGITDPKKKDALGALSRRKKHHGIKNSALVREWRSRLTDSEAEALAKLTPGKRAQPSQPRIAVRTAMDEAVEKVFAKDSVVEANKLVSETLRFGFGSVTPEAAWREFDRRKMIVREIEGKWLCTSLDILEEEVALIDYVREGKGKFQPFSKAKTPSLDPCLSDEQRAAVCHLLRSYDRVMAVRGGAGVGKTTLMKEAVQQIEATGKKVFAFAPSAESSRGTLRESGFANAETVAHLLANPKLQKQVRGQVIWIDEAGLLGIRDMQRITRIAGKDTRIILTGDTAQHRPVPRGDSLSLIERYAGLEIAHVSKVRRQRTKEYRSAVEALSRGDLKSGFKRLDGLGAIIEIPDEAERYQRLAQEYAALCKGEYAPLVVSPTHREGAMATAAIRGALREAGRIGSERTERSFTRYQNLAWEEPDRRLVGNYRPGLVVQFNQNAKGITRGSVFHVSRVEKGEVWMANGAGRQRQLPLDSVAKFDVFEEREIKLARGDRLRITRNGKSADGKRLNNGNVFTVEGFNRAGQIVLTTGAKLNANHGHIKHGYLETSYSSQSKSVRDVLVAQSSTSFVASSLQQYYVTVSRGQESIRIFTDDRDALQEAVGNTSLRRSGLELAGLSASDITPTMTDEPKEPSWQDRVRDRFKGQKKFSDLIESRKGPDGTVSHGQNILKEKGQEVPVESFQKAEEIRKANRSTPGAKRDIGLGPKKPKRKEMPVPGIGDGQRTVRKTGAQKIGDFKNAQKANRVTKQKRMEGAVKASKRHLKQVGTKIKGTAKKAGEKVGKVRTKVASTYHIAKAKIKRYRTKRRERAQTKAKVKAPTPSPRRR